MEKKVIGLLLTSIYGGGAEKVAADLSIYFENCGYEVIFLITSNRITKKYPHKGKIIRLSGMLGLNAGMSLRQQWETIVYESDKIRKIKNNNKIDMTISFSPYNNLHNILSKGKDKVITTIHNVVSLRKEYSWEMSYHKEVFKYLYPIADKTVTVSNYCKEDLINNMHLNRRRIQVIANPIRIEDLERNSEEEPEEDLGKNAVLSIGRFDDVKQQWHLLRAFSAVCRKCPDARLYLLGQGANLAYLNELVERQQLQNSVVFLGFQNNVAKYLKRAKILVSTSASEAFPCTYMEALSMGIPVVANDCPGGTREILAPDNTVKRTLHDNQSVRCGILTPRLDGNKYTADAALTLEEEKLGKAIADLLLNPKIRKFISENCKQEARKYDINIIGKIWENLFDKLK